MKHEKEHENMNAFGYLKKRYFILIVNRDMPNAI